MQANRSSTVNYGFELFPEVGQPLGATPNVWEARMQKLLGRERIVEADTQRCVTTGLLQLL